MVYNRKDLLMPIYNSQLFFVCALVFACADFKGVFDDEDQSLTSKPINTVFQLGGLIDVLNCILPYFKGVIEH